MTAELGEHYPDGFVDLLRHLHDTEMPVEEQGATLCAAAVLFSVDCLHPRTMTAVAIRILESSDEHAHPALAEVAASTDPERDPQIRAMFRTFLSSRGLERSADEGWGVLARVGIRHIREIATQMVSGHIDAVDGALAIAARFVDYLPAQERTRLAGAGEHRGAARALEFEPFAEFIHVEEHLYQAGFNLHRWNDRLPYAPSNVLSDAEKAEALARLRTRFVELARRGLDASSA